MKDEIFSGGRWHQSWGEIWREDTFGSDVLQKMRPIPQGLILRENDQESALERILVDESNPQAHLKLAWIYAGIGWYEKAIPHIKQALENANGIDQFYLNYVYGKSLEETFVNNPLTKKIDLTGNVKVNQAGISKNDFSTELDEIQSAYNKAVNMSEVYRSSAYYPQNEISYMKGWLVAYQYYQPFDRVDFTQSADIQQILKAYIRAVQLCPESFFFRQKCFQILSNDWRFYSDLTIGFRFHGIDGYYQLTFQGLETKDYAPYVQLIRIIQFFDKVTYTQSKKIRSVEDVTADLLTKEFLSLPPYNGLIGQIRSSKINFGSVMSYLFPYLQYAEPREKTPPLATHRRPWRAVITYQDRGQEYSNRHLPLLASRAYLKSLLLVPTIGVRHELQALLPEIRRRPVQKLASPGLSFLSRPGERDGLPDTYPICETNALQVSSCFF